MAIIPVLRGSSGGWEPCSLAVSSVVMDGYGKYGAFSGVASDISRL